MYILIMAVAVILIAVIVWKSLKMKPIDTSEPTPEDLPPETDDTAAEPAENTAESSEPAENSEVI